MPVMDGLHATRLIRAFEESGNWDAAVSAGIEPELSCSGQSNMANKSSTKRIHIIAVSPNLHSLIWRIYTKSLSYLKWRQKV